MCLHPYAGWLRYDAFVKFRMHPRVHHALETHQAVVALESTVISHGLPHPHNLRLARSLEHIVRNAGAVPATIAVLAGTVVVGLEDHELEQLAAEPAHKASLWNLPALISQGQNAATTVATTLHIAAHVGIKVFSTGGIGGVHSEAFDESADLLALARYPLAVVCAGAKSVLNVAATLERLETLGVPVIGYQSNYLAGFHVPQTDLPLAARCEDAQALAHCFMTQRSLGYKHAMLVSKPVLQGLAAEEVARWKDQAHHDLVTRGITGKDVTPFLLERFAELSQGRTIDVNIRLLEENAQLAAEIALALGRLHADPSYAVT